MEDPKIFSIIKSIRIKYFLKKMEDPKYFLNMKVLE